MRILRNAAIPGLAVRHLKLHTRKDMLNLAADAGLEVLDFADKIFSRTSFQNSWPQVDPVRALFSFLIGLEFFAFSHPDIAGIRDDADDVVGVDVQLHAEMPRISLFLPLDISGSRL